MKIMFKPHKKVVQVLVQADGTDGVMIGHIRRDCKGSPKWRPELSLMCDLGFGEKAYGYQSRPLDACQQDVTAAWRELDAVTQGRVLGHAEART